MMSRGNFFEITESGVKGLETDVEIPFHGGVVYATVDQNYLRQIQDVGKVAIERATEAQAKIDELDDPTGEEAHAILEELKSSEVRRQAEILAKLFVSWEGISYDGGETVEPMSDGDGNELDPTVETFCRLDAQQTGQWIAGVAIALRPKATRSMRRSRSSSSTARRRRRN